MHRLLLLLVLALLGCGFAQASPGLGLDFVGLWLCTGVPQSFTRLLWALFVHRLPLVLVLPLLGFGYAQASPGLCLAFSGLWLCTGFPLSGSFLCWALVMHRLSPVFVLPLLGYGFAQDSPSLSLVSAGGWALVVYMIPLVLFLTLLHCVCSIPLTTRDYFQKFSGSNSLGTMTSDRDKLFRFINHCLQF